MEQKLIDSVKEFHIVFGHPVRTDVYTDCYAKEPTLIPIRIGFIQEELDEIIVALKNDDIVEIADGLADMLYFLYGLGHILGLSMVKSHRYKKTDNIVDTFDYMTTEVITLNNKIKLLRACSNVLSLAFNILLLIDYIYDICNTINMNIYTIFLEVHRSNMTKVCKTEADAIDTVNKYKTDKTYPNPMYRYSNGYYIVYEKSTNKILKNHKWEAPNIKPLLL